MLQNIEVRVVNGDFLLHTINIPIYIYILHKYKT